jgi:hypothetical protein
MIASSKKICQSWSPSHLPDHLPDQPAEWVASCNPPHLAKTRVSVLTGLLHTHVNAHLATPVTIAKSTSTSAHKILAKTVPHAMTALPHTHAHAPLDSRESIAKLTLMSANQNHVKMAVCALI